MSADELRSKAAQDTRRSWVRPLLLMALPLAGVWTAAFAITGLLWWGAPTQVEQVPPPEAPELEAIDAQGVDLELYGRAHPMWVPGP